MMRRPDSGKALWARHTLALLLALLLGLLAACGRAADSSSPASVATPTTATPTTAAPALASGQQLLVLPDDGAAPVLALVDQAQSSIRFKIYLLTYGDMRQALLRAAERGVDVRVLIEPHPIGGEESNRSSFDILQQGGVQVRWASSRYRLTHEKSLVIDERLALIGTFNYTASSFASNREFGLLTTEPDIVQGVAKIFDADWEGRPASLPASSTLVLSPDNSRQRILDLIDRARTSLWLEQATLLDDEVAAHLAAAARRGVLVRFLGPERQGEEDRAEPNYQLLREAGAQVARLGEPLIHAKVIVADGHTALLGSVNLTYSSLDLNRELSLFTEDAEVLARLQRVLAEDWAKAARPTTAPAGVIDWREVGDYVGAVVTVEGVVARTHDTGKVTFLNFSEDWRGALSIVIFASDYHRFDAPPAILYRDKKIRVTGKVKEYKGAPEIIVETPAQIEIVGGETGALPPTRTPEAPASVVPWTRAGEYLGQVITVGGRIVRTHDTGNITFLNFSRERGQFTVVIFADDYTLFPQSPAKMYNGKQVWVTGEITEYKGAPQIVVHSPAQIEVFE